MECPLCSAASRRLFQLDYGAECGQAWKCTVCRLQFVHPQPSDGSLRALYSQLYFSEHSVYSQTDEGIFDQVVENYLGPALAFCTDRQPLVVDYGSGDGALVRVLRGRGIAAVGLDPFAPTDPAAGVFESFSDLQNVRREAGEGVDLIVLNEVIEHLRDPWRIVGELWAHLRPGASMYISTPNFAGLRSRVLRAKYEQYLNPTHLFFFTPGTLHHLLERVCGQSPRRLRTRIRYPHRSTVAAFCDRGLQFAGLDGDVKMVVTKPPSGVALRGRGV